MSSRKVSIPICQIPIIGCHNENLKEICEIVFFVQKCIKIFYVYFLTRLTQGYKELDELENIMLYLKLSYNYVLYLAEQ